MLIHKETRKINYPMLAKVIGWLLMIESVFLAVPMLVALSYEENDWKAFGISASITLITGFCLNTFVRPSHNMMAKREGFLLTALVWVIFSLFGMLPFMLCDTPIVFTDAFFEAMAGFTTTGCSAFPDIDSLSHGINFWRAFMQWLGGLGIIIFTLAVIPMLNHSGGLQMFNAEVTGITHEKIRPRISQTAKTLWGVYLVLTLACALLLWAGPMSFFDSLCHAFGTVSTGGFSTHTESLHYWASPYVDCIIIFFMLLGGTNFTLIYFSAKGDFKPIKRNRTFRIYLRLVLIYYIIFMIIAVLHGQYRNFTEIVMYPLFQVVATMTSTGYLSPLFFTWGQVAFALLVPMMVFGGCAGSTSGGAKVDRFVVLVRYLRNSLKKALFPNNITSVKFDGRVLSIDTVSKTIAFLCFYVLIAFSGGLLLMLFDIPIVDSFFTSISCMSNLGLGADIINAGTPIAMMPYGAKWILAALMLIGRLEVFTILIIFNPLFWHK